MTISGFAPATRARLIEALPAASLSRIYILYPDPWPKRRQHKRPLISAEHDRELARVAKPGAEIRFATDIDDYAGWTLARFLRSPDFEWLRRPRRRLAPALARLGADALRGQGARRRPGFRLPDLPSAATWPGALAILPFRK